MSTVGSTVAKPSFHEVGRFEIFGLLVAAAVVRFMTLGTRSVWLDEGFTWTTASSPLPKLIEICATQDATPPLSYALTGLFLQLGSSEATLRLLSCLASIGIVWLTYRLARLFADRTTSGNAAILAALSPFQVMYAQEARSYTLVALLLVASTYFFLRAGLRGGRRDWVLYGATLTAGLYTQSIIALGVLIQVALFVCIPPIRSRFRGWLAATAVAMVLYVPWLVAAAAQTRHLSESHWYLETPGAREIFHVLRGIAIAPIPLVTAPPTAPGPGLEAVLPRGVAQLLLFVLPGIPVLLGVWTARRSDARGWLARTGLVGLVVPLSLVTVLSTVSPRLLPRFFVFESSFLCLLMAAGITALRPARLGSVWIVLLVALGCYAILRYDIDYTKERWREAVQLVDIHGISGRKAALVTFDIDPFAFYNEKLESPMPAFEYSHPEVPFSNGFTLEQLVAMQRGARRQTRDFDEVWVLVRDPKSESRLRAVREAREVAGDGRRFVGEWRLDSTAGTLYASCWRR